MLPNEMAAAAAALVAKTGAPMTAENMNRAMSAIMEGSEDMSGGNSPVMEAAITRTMGASPPQPARRRGALPLPPPAMPPREGAVTEEGATAAAAPAATPRPEMDSPPTAASPNQTRGARVAAGAQPGGRRAGTINGATRINEEAPADGMHGGTPGRQADETGVDQLGLAGAMAAPFTVAGGAAGAAGVQGMLRQRLIAQNIAKNEAAVRGGRLAAQARRGVNADRRAFDDPRGDVVRAR